MDEKFIGFDCRSGLEPHFQDIATKHALPKLFSLDNNVYPRETKTSAIGANDEPFFPSMDEMLAYIEKYSVLTPECFLVSVFEDVRRPDDIEYWAYFFHVLEPIPAVEKKFLGYDVGDGAPFSGLLNAGVPVNLKTLRDRLNDYGLFLDVNEARNFADECARLVPEHAPFFVFGVYRLPTPTRK